MCIKRVVVDDWSEIDGVVFDDVGDRGLISRSHAS